MRSIGTITQDLLKQAWRTKKNSRAKSTTNGSGECFNGGIHFTIGSALRGGADPCPVSQQPAGAVVPEKGAASKNTPGDQANDAAAPHVGERGRNL